MENIIDNTEEILNNHISGFHKYILQDPVHLAFVSQNLCNMTGYSQEELLSESTDLYATVVHPSDKQLYLSFIHELAQKEQKLTVQYRIVRKDGTVMYVSDNATSKYLENGTLAGYSVLVDITDVKEENSALKFLNETIPCGFIKYTCEKQPKVTYVNDQMLKILRFPMSKEGETDYLEFYKNNIFLMVPMEERNSFADFLNQVYTKDSPMSGEISVLRFDGTKARLYGWVTKFTNKQGEEEFQSVCMDITERYRTKRAAETERYLKALSEVYDKIYEYNFSNKTVKYVYGSKSNTFMKIHNIPMDMEEATEQWIQNTVYEEDHTKVRDFFEKIFHQQLQDHGSRPPQIRFRSMSADGKVKGYMGIFIKIDNSINLFCCRSILDEQEAATLQEENTSLKNMNETMQEVVMQFTEGIVAFEIDNDNVKPLYASDNVCKFFGYTKEEWLSMAQKSHPIKEFISHSTVAYEDIAKLLETGEGEFTYFDEKANIQRRIKAVLSQKYSDGNSPRYVMLYNVDMNTKQNPNGLVDNAHVYIRTFGYFDVFVDGKPIAFRNKKSKELLALLVDRRGGYVSSEESISFLWEDEPVNSVTLARYRKVALRLKNILEEYGITDIIESVDGKRRIVTEKVRCDLYDYLSQKEEYSQLFKGSYMTNYSWGEITLGELLNGSKI